MSIQETKVCPGCIHSMKQYLAELEGMSHLTEERYGTYEEAKNASPKIYYIHIIVDGIEHRVSEARMAKGAISIFRYWVDRNTFDVRRDSISEFIVRRPKTLDELSIKPEKAGKYNDSLGGGWSQSVQMYRVNDKYFAEMDCAC